MSSLDKIRVCRFTSASQISVDVNLSVKYQIQGAQPPGSQLPPQKGQARGGGGSPPSHILTPGSPPPSTSTAVSLVYLYVVTAEHGGAV